MTVLIKDKEKPSLVANNIKTVDELEKNLSKTHDLIIFGLPFQPCQDSQGFKIFCADCILNLLLCPSISDAHRKLS